MDPDLYTTLRRYAVSTCYSASSFLSVFVSVRQIKLASGHVLGPRKQLVTVIMDS